jgi:hypothetical protein
MLICYKCKQETDLPSKSESHKGEGFCPKCLKNLKARTRRRDMDEAAAMCGLVKVRGALGGIYYE